MFNVIIELNAPIKVLVTVEELTEDAVLDAVWKDLKNPESTNDWRPSYGDLKDVIRESYFLEEDWQEFLASKGQDQLVAYR
jgi:hypothetical protein